MPAVRPVCVHVGVTAWSITSTCPKAETIFWVTNSSLHVEQWLPSVRPVLVQVGTIAWSTTTVCPKAST